MSANFPDWHNPFLKRVRGTLPLPKDVFASSKKDPVTEPRPYFKGQPRFSAQDFATIDLSQQLNHISQLVCKYNKHSDQPTEQIKIALNLMKEVHTIQKAFSYNNKKTYPGYEISESENEMRIKRIKSDGALLFDISLINNEHCIYIETKSLSKRFFKFN